MKSFIQTENFTVIMPPSVSMVINDFASSEGFPLGRRTLHIIGGTGAGQVRDVVSNTNSTLVVTPAWTVVPDNTSIIEIRKEAMEVLGEPSSLYDARNNRQFVERKGSLYSLSYQVQVIGSNPEQTIYLYTILKAILTLSRLFLEGQGVINLKMGGTDFLPRTDYLPDMAYMRALNLQFMYPFDVFEPLEDLVTQFNISLIATAEGQSTTLIDSELEVGKPLITVI